jgi:hypothetical protein
VGRREGGKEGGGVSTEHSYRRVVHETQDVLGHNLGKSKSKSQSKSKSKSESRTFLDTTLAPNTLRSRPKKLPEL